MTVSGPILVAHLFPEISQHLVDLLRSLSCDEWHRPTVSSRRNVKDVVSHLLDGSLRRLSMQRDNYRPPDGSSFPHGSETLVDFLNRLNDEWEVGTRRLSPTVLIGLTEWADKQLADLFQSLDPHAPAFFPVAWAGELQSANWLDIGRDYTEKWHHTQQIFEAVNKPTTIMVPHLAYPCFSIFMRALPFTLAATEVVIGTVVCVVIEGECGGVWYVQRHQRSWQFTETQPATTTVRIHQDTFWKLVTKRRTAEQLRSQFGQVQIDGDKALGSRVLEMVSVMA